MTATILLLLACLPFCREAVCDPCPSPDDPEGAPILPINTNRDTDIRITLAADKSEVAPGEKIVLRIRVDVQCCVTILSVDPTGQVVRLWPNDYSGDDCRVPPESLRELPGPADGFDIVAVGPGGGSRLLAVAASEKGSILDADGFIDSPDTPFKIFKSTGEQLALDVRRKVESLPASARWGTAQLNLCVTEPASLEPKSTAPAQPSPRSLRDPARRPISGHHSGSRSVGGRNGSAVPNSSGRHGRSDGAFLLSPAMVAKLKSGRQERRSAGLSPSRTASLVRSQRPEPVHPSAVRDKGLHILAFGVSTGRLQYCEEDARKLAYALQRTSGAKRENVRLLRGPEVTYNGMVGGMEWLISRTRPEDEVVVYFSGHGAFVPDRAPFDEQDGRDEVFVLYHKQKPRDYEAALEQRIVMLDDDFSELMKRIPARKKLLIVDSCHSGTISKGEDSLPGNLVSKFYPLADPETGENLRLVHSKGTGADSDNEHHALLSACLDSESSFEHQGWKGAVFTHFLLEAVNTWKPDLHTAFWHARDKTHRFIRKISVSTGGRIGTQTPQLTDPYGFSKAFVFSN